MQKLTLGFLSIALLSLGACSTEVADTTQSVRYTTVNLVTPLDGGETYVTEGSYTFDLNLTQLYGKISTNSLKIGTKDYSFTTDSVPTLNYTGMEGFYIRFQNLKGYLDRDTSMPLSNANFDITSLFYTPTASIPEYSEKQDYMPYIIGQFTAGDWYVATLQKDATYIGTTTTSYKDADGANQSYENKDMYYRLVIDIDKKTADLIIYNAKFASAAPTLTGIRLTDLPVNFGSGTYTIDVENKVPQYIEGNAWADIPRFVFNSFSLSATNKELTKVKMNYVVAGIYSGSFTGACVVELFTGN